MTESKRRFACSAAEMGPAPTRSPMRMYMPAGKIKSNEGLNV
ncbi:MAG: hypothetical protein OXG78_00920 [Chloroflexi bacterium]|nr:hypothetical protein [Chloroflexota bacterium]